MKRNLATTNMQMGIPKVDMYAMREELTKVEGESLTTASEFTPLMSVHHLAEAVSRVQGRPSEEKHVSKDSLRLG